MFRFGVAVTCVVHPTVVHSPHHQGHHRCASDRYKDETASDGSYGDENDGDHEHGNAARDHHQAVTAATLLAGSWGRRLNTMGWAVDHDDRRSDAGTCPRR